MSASRVRAIFVDIDLDERFKTLAQQEGRTYSSEPRRALAQHLATNEQRPAGERGAGEGVRVLGEGESEARARA